MRLKRLILHGFKSFADKTEFEFELGLTGIIGPNGCGKSNVVDAVKWVLGDQRPTSLRGKEMLDVIFNGAEGRPAMGCSEVTLVLERDVEPAAQPASGDGAEGTNGTELASLTRETVEMTVGRRLFRSGESEYLLNGRAVRLKDVREALMDTGLGVGAYSVMEQGKIDAVLSANPDERRSIFDEAAGISRYKVRRKEALRKLDKTEQNLARVGDLRRERSSRVRSLKIQATRARNYRVTLERLMALKVAVAVTESQSLGETQARLASEIEAAELAVAEAEAQRDGARDELATDDGTIKELAARVSELKDLHAELRAEVRSRREALEAGKARAGRLDDLETRSKREAGRLDQRLAENAASSADLERATRELEADRGHVGEQLPELERTARATKTELAKAQRARETVQSDLLACLQERTRARNLVRDKELRGEALEARRRRLSDERVEIERRLFESRQEATRLATQLVRLAQRQARLTMVRSEHTTETKELECRRHTLTERLRGLRDKRAGLVSQRDVLRDLEASFTGMDEAARELLESGEGVVGRLVEFVRCPLEIGAALEAALGARVQALVVEDFDRARDALEALAERAGGGSLELLHAEGPAAPAKLEPKPGEDEFDPESLIPAGIPLMSLCDVDMALREPIGRLLDNVVVVRDLNAARYLQVDDCARCYVTLRGEVCYGGWVSGGTKEQAAGLFQRRIALERLEDECAAVAAELAEVEGAEHAAAAALERRRGQERRFVALAEALGREHTALSHKIEAREKRADELDEELEADSIELAEIDDERLDAICEMMAPLINAMLYERRQKRLDEDQARLLEQCRELDREVQSRQQAYSEMAMRKASLDAELGGMHKRAELFERSRAELERRQVELAAEGARANEKARELAAELAKLRIELADFQCRSEFVDDLVKQSSNELNELETAAGVRRDELVALENALEKSRERRAELVLEHREIGFKIRRWDEEIHQRFRVCLPRLRGEVEGYGLWLDGPLLGPELPEGELRDRVVLASLQGPPAAPDFYRHEQELPHLWEFESFDRDEAEKEAGVLEARIGRMGNINLDAEGELEAAEAEFEQLERDWKDLEEARRQLIETLRRINAESRTLFEQTFNQARVHFQEIFRVLFRGGKADIELVDSDDPLEAGIEIYARPPGKELRSIRLLSGGERSLTALAILFGVFKVKPSPFCILDEVDAALDEANVDRFLEVLAGFAAKTQFLVVTHHKRTMADCEVLYGVTMPKSGVSTRMSVKLGEGDDVDRVLDHSPGQATEVARTVGSPQQN